MKQKYSILLDNENKQLIIREYAELDKEILSLLCEETYEDGAIKAAIKAGKENLIAMLRTKNLYPPSIYVDKIADAVVDLYQSKEKEALDLFFDDLELLIKGQELPEAAESIEEEGTDLDEVLEDDFEDAFEDKEDINKIDSPLKIADDDFVDIDEES